MRRAFYKHNGFDLDKAGNRLLVDKMPLNLLFAGLIKRVFPGAKFILALRHPCDAVLSCFMQQFNLNPFMQRFVDLADGAAFYDETFRVWERYRAIFDLDVHTIRYEDLVADFRNTTGRLLDFLGVPWDEAVMEFDKTALSRGYIKTPSYHQVTEKIYTRAVDRWQRYHKQMEPVLPVLAPWAEKFGYSMEPPAPEKA
jgi:hypothetical protein